MKSDFTGEKLYKTELIFYFYKRAAFLMWEMK